MTPPGTLWLVPAPLDLGAAEMPLDTVLPQAVLARAAALQHWVVEDAKSARALLKRVAQHLPLAQPLQALHMAELPRPPKGGARGTAPAVDWAALLAPALQGHDLGLLSEAGLPAVAIAWVLKPPLRCAPSHSCRLQRRRDHSPQGCRAGCRGRG